MDMGRAFPPYTFNKKIGLVSNAGWEVGNNGTEQMKLLRDFPVVKN